jgi:hypothetical protein
MSEPIKFPGARQVSFSATLSEFSMENLFADTPTTLRFERSWKSRLLSWPWRPWVKAVEFRGAMTFSHETDDGVEFTMKLEP